MNASERTAISGLFNSAHTSAVSPAWGSHVFPPGLPPRGDFYFRVSIYSFSMNTLPIPQTGEMLVICAPHAARETISALVAELALHGSLTVLDGGNRFQPYAVARLLRQRTADLNTVAKRLFIRRAFTCYQVLALLEGTPALRQPYLVLDMLTSFQDEHVRDDEAGRLLDACLRQLERLCRVAPLVVTLSPPPAARPGVPERAFLIEKLCARAGRLLMPEPLPAPATQLTLFGGS